MTEVGVLVEERRGLRDMVLEVLKAECEVTRSRPTAY
jgi:hypothetical protein